jgi:hypothetical protein
MCTTSGLLKHLEKSGLRAVAAHGESSIPPESLYSESSNNDRLYGLVVRVSGYRCRGHGSISGATTFSEK